MDIGVIIPAFNAEKSIEHIIQQVKMQVGHNVIVVDDGSFDNTGAIAANENIIVLSHKYNQGKGAALRTGFKKAKALNWKGVITIDSDGQHNPEYITKFIEHYNSTRADIIIGSRMNNLQSMPFHRVLSNKITSKLLSWRIGQEIVDSQCGYRFICTDVLREIKLVTSHYETESEILIRSGMAGFKIDFIDIDTIYKNEPSSIKLFLDTWRFIKLYWQSFFQ